MTLFGVFCGQSKKGQFSGLIAALSSRDLLRVGFQHVVALVLCAHRTDGGCNFLYLFRWREDGGQSQRIEQESRRILHRFVCFYFLASLTGEQAHPWSNKMNDCTCTCTCTCIGHRVIAADCLVLFFICGERGGFWFVAMIFVQGCEEGGDQK